MPVSRYLSQQAITRHAAVLLLFACLGVTWVQVEWSFRPESPGSPMDIAGLIMGHMVALAALYASQKFVPGSCSRTMMVGMAALCYGLATAEYLLDAGLLDIPISALWLAAGVFLLFSQTLRRESARVWFLVAMGIATAELIRDLAGAVLYGPGQALPPLFPWMDAGSDLLICAFYLLGFVDLVNGGEPSPTEKVIGGGDAVVRDLLALAGTPLRHASLARRAPASALARQLAPVAEAPGVPRPLGWEVRLAVHGSEGEKLREEYFDVAVEDPIEAAEAVRRVVAVSDSSHARVMAVAAIPADVFHALGLSRGEIKPQ